MPESVADFLARTETIDGVPGVPALVVVALGGPAGDPWRWPRFGRVLAAGPVEFPAPYGERLVVFCEGGAVAYYPDADPAQRVQKVHWRDLERVAAALGLA